jgi:hypothetical protein
MEFGKHLIGVHNNEAIELKSLDELKTASQEAKQKSMVVVAMGGKSIKIVPQRNFFEKITAFFSGELRQESRNLKNLRISLGGDNKRAGAQQLHPARGSSPSSSPEKLFQDTLEFLVDDIRAGRQHQTLLRSIELGKTPEAKDVPNSIGLNDGYAIDPERKFKSSTGNGPLRTVNLEISNLLKVKQTLNSLSNIKASPENTNLKNKLEPLFVSAAKLGQTQLLGIEGFRPVGTSESIKATLDEVPREALLNKLAEVAQVIEQINTTLIRIKDSDPLSPQNSEEIEAKLAQINLAIAGLNPSTVESMQESVAAAAQNVPRKQWEEPIAIEDIKIEMEDELETEQENIVFSKPGARKQWEEPIAIEDIKIEMEDELQSETKDESIEFSKPGARKQWGEAIAREDIRFEAQSETEASAESENITFTNTNSAKKTS